MHSIPQLTTSQTARELGLSRGRVRQLAQAGRLEVVETPLGSLFDSDCVQQLAEERQQQAERTVDRVGSENSGVSKTSVNGLKTGPIETGAGVLGCTRVTTAAIENKAITRAVRPGRYVRFLTLRKSRFLLPPIAACLFSGVKTLKICAFYRRRKRGKCD